MHKQKKKIENEMKSHVCTKYQRPKYFPTWYSFCCFVWQNQNFWNIDRQVRPRTNVTVAQYGRRIFIIFYWVTRARLPTVASIEFQTKFKLRLIWLANERAKAKWSEARVYWLRVVWIRSSGDSVRCTDSIIDLQRATVH